MLQNVITILENTIKHLEALDNKQNSNTKSNYYLKGGSWSTAPWYCRSAVRSEDVPDNRYDFSGFRVAAGTFPFAPIGFVPICGFLIGTHPVTFGQFQRFVKETQYHWDSRGQKNFDHPVVYVNVKDCNAYCNWLNYTNSAYFFRLPTVEEWEQTAGSNEYSWGNEHPNKDNCNCDNWFSGTTPVGNFPPSPLGLYDMNGNVWEWTTSKE